jgi:RimJ/RimL family protein N-acetyltransferase
MDFRTIEFFSRRLRLSAFVERDLAEIFSVVTPTLTQFMAFDPSPSFESFREISAAWPQQMAQGEALWLVVRSAQTNEFLGLLGMHNFDASDPVLGVWIKESAHGRRYGFEAVSALVAWAGRDLGIAAVTYSVVEQNLASRRIAERLAGTITGASLLEKSAGITHPMVIYRIPTPAAN